MKHWCWLLIFLPLSSFAEVELRDAWARATAPGMPMGAVYGEFANEGNAEVTLTAISTRSARMAEIHESVEIDGMMRMREITPFVIPAGKSVFLRPAGKHIMLMGLGEALVEGETLTINATFSDGSEISVDAVVGGFGQMSKPE